MQALGNILTSLNTTLTKKGISVSNELCENKIDGQPCKRRLQILDGKKYCFYCDIIAKEDKQLALETKNAHKQMIVGRMFNKESLINPRLKQCDFSNYYPPNEQLDKAKKICERYADNFNKNNPVNLILIGNYGTGKSHMAVSILKRVFEKGMESQNGYQCVFISTPKLMTKLKDTYNKQSDHSEAALLDTLEKVDLLILDDIGAELRVMERQEDEEKANSWAVSKLLEIIDGRLGKHTVYTTNFEYEMLMRLYGERNFSRMMEGTTPIKMNGENYRLRDFK